MSEAKTEERVTICYECEHCYPAPFLPNEHLCRAVPETMARSYVSGISYTKERRLDPGAHCHNKNSDGKCKDFKVKA